MDETVSENRLSLLIKKEILEQIMTLRFAIACILCFVVILSSVFVQTRGYRNDLLDYQADVLMHRDEFLQYEDPHDLMRGGIYVDQPLNVMTIFFKGMDRGSRMTVRMTSEREMEFQAGSYERSLPVRPFPTMDLVFFIGIIMSLLAIAFSYDAISGENESGTLRLMMSYSIPRDIVLLGKWIGGYVALIVPFLISILCGLIIVLMFPDVHLTLSNWLELGVMIVISLVYISAIYSLGIFVSARTKGASTSIITLLLIWVMVILVIPNISPDIASQIRPVSIQSLGEEKRRIWEDEMRKYREKDREWHRELPHDEAHRRLRDLLEETRIRIAAQQKKVTDDFNRSLTAQMALAKNISRVSPLPPFIYSAVEISGTGMNEREHFMRALVRYRDRWVEYAEEKHEHEDEGFDLSDHPRFVYEAIALGDRLKGIFTDVLMLGIWNVVFFMGAYVSFLRYDMAG